MSAENRGAEIRSPETRSAETRSPNRYVWMVLVALTIRLAVIPFVYQDWMDPFVLEHWAFGLIARSIASGHGFGSPFAQTGASALLPPVYSYLLAAIFKVFGIETKASVLAALSLNSVFSALTCIPVFFWRAVPSEIASPHGRAGDGRFLPMEFITARVGRGPPAWSRSSWLGSFCLPGASKILPALAIGYCSAFLEVLPR